MAHPANLLGALKETYLTKCGGSHKSWKTRWFVLTKDVLYYFDREMSTQPLGMIHLKDYCKCKGMEGDAYQVTGRDNSFYLQMPYRTYKMFATEWRTSEDWAESIANLGDFIHKKEDVRNPTPYQQTVLTNAGDIISCGSSLIHWFKLIVDSTPTYKKGIRSIYNAAIYDIPRELGRQVTLLARDALNVIAHPRSMSDCDKLKMQLQKVDQWLIKASDFITCCADAHKGNFNQDMLVLKRAIAALMEIKPSSAVDEIKTSAAELEDAAMRLCKQAIDKVTGPPVTINSIHRKLATAVDSNLAVIKTKPQSPQEQKDTVSMQGNVDLCRQASAKLAALAQQADSNMPVDPNSMRALHTDIAAACNEIVGAAARLFPDAGPTP